MTNIAEDDRKVDWTKQKMDEPNGTNPEVFPDLTIIRLKSCCTSLWQNLSSCKSLDTRFVFSEKCPSTAQCTHVGRCENGKYWKLYFPHMKFYSTKIASHAAMQSCSPPKVKIFVKHTMILIVKRSISKTWKQKKNPLDSQSYGSGTIPENVPKLLLVQFWYDFVNCSATIILINMRIFPLGSLFQVLLDYRNTYPLKK